MNTASGTPRVTVCLLTFGDYYRLASRALESICQNGERGQYRLIVGANAVCRETRELLEQRHASGDIDELLISPTNLSKCPLMRRMFANIDTDYIWWFDDDSYITEAGALTQWVRAADAAPKSNVIWGQLGWCDHRLGFCDIEDIAGFVRSAPWYRGLPPPSWKPGGKGEFNFRGEGQGDGRWFFIFGGCWMIRTDAVRRMDWPDPRLTRHGDDVFLGEAVRQQGWEMGNVGPLGVAINTEPRRFLRSNPATRHDLNLFGMDQLEAATGGARPRPS